MFHEYRSALILLTRWTAPTRRVCHREKGQRRRRGRFYPTVQSVACSELLTPSERNRPVKNTSCCDPDKDTTERQVAGSQNSEASGRAAFVFTWGEQMAKEMPGNKEDDAGCSTECGVQEPEVRRWYFL